MYVLVYHITFFTKFTSCNMCMCIHTVSTLWYMISIDIWIWITPNYFKTNFYVKSFRFKYLLKLYNNVLPNLIKFRSNHPTNFFVTEKWHFLFIEISYNFISVFCPSSDTNCYCWKRIFLFEKLRSFDFLDEFVVYFLVLYYITSVK